jgi:hypothetical protein
MKKVKLFITLILAGAFMISCGSGSNISKDAAKKLENYDTYSYLPNKDTILSQDYNNQQIQETIIATINDNMASEGYAIENRQPDVLVYVHTMFDEKVAVNANPVYTNFSYYRPGHYIGPYYENYTYDNYFTIQRITADDAIKQLPYKEKSIVIDFIDRRTNEILWRGTAPEEEISSKRLERDLRDYIDEIFTKFP